MTYSDEVWPYLPHLCKIFCQGVCVAWLETALEEKMLGRIGSCLKYNYT